MKYEKSIIFCIAIILLIAFHVGLKATNANGYPSHYLTAQNEVRTVSVDYSDADSDESANKVMDKKVDSYLHSIKNIKKYKVSVKPEAVNDDPNVRFEGTLTDTIQLSRR